MVPRLEGISDGDESFSVDLAPSKTSEKKSDTSKNDVDKILDHYRKQWGSQKVAADQTTPVYDPYEMESEVIDDVLAEEDSDSHNTTSTSALFGESFSQLSQPATREKEEKEIAVQSASVRIESPPQRYQPTNTRLQKLEDISIPGVTVTSDVHNISISSSSTISDAESQLTDELMQDVGSTQGRSDDLITEIQGKSLKSTGFTVEALNSAMKYNSKIPDDDNKSDSGVSDSTLSKGSLEDLMAYDYTNTQVPRSTMKNLISLGSYKDKLPKRSSEILAYPVYGASTKPDKKEKEAKPADKPRQAKSVTFDVNGDEVTKMEDGSHTDPSVLEGQELINRYAPSADADVLTKVTKVSTTY